MYIRPNCNTCNVSEVKSEEYILGNKSRPPAILHSICQPSVWQLWYRHSNQTEGRNSERMKEVMEQWLESKLNCAAGATHTCTRRKDQSNGCHSLLCGCLLKQKHPENRPSLFPLLPSQSCQSNCSNWSRVGAFGTSWKPVNSKTHSSGSILRQPLWSNIFRQKLSQKVRRPWSLLIWSHKSWHKWGDDIEVTMPYS